jgi:HSP20 family protein
MGAYREAGTFVVHLDLPGGSAESIDLTVEQNVLTVHAERKPPPGESAERVVDERPSGVFSQQPCLGTLDPDRLNADHDTGVLTLTIPIAEKTKPRRIEITSGSERKQINA